MRSIIRLPILTHSLRLCQRIWPAQGADNLALALKNLQSQAYNGTKNVIISFVVRWGCGGGGLKKIDKAKVMVLRQRSPKERVQTHQQRHATRYDSASATRPGCRA